MSADGIIDDYLEGLLQDVIACERSAKSAQSAAASAPVAIGADVASASASASVLADAVLAEADADPALAGILSQPPAEAPRKGPTPEELAAAVLAEADADPALAGILSQPPAEVPRKGPTPEELAAAVLAEADADPALAGILSKQIPSSGPRSLAETDDVAALAAAGRPPMAIPPERRAEAERSLASPHWEIPHNLQSFMPPSTREPTLHNRRAPDRSTRWLRLRCGEQAYALELLKVQEVVLPVPLLPLRGTPASMLGIMNLRGQVVPVVDLGLHLGTAPVQMDASTRVVVLEENGETLGLRVSAVEDVASLTDHQIEPPDNARICRISNDLFRGVARIAEQPMILLDAQHLLH